MAERKEQQWDGLLKIKTTGRDDSRADRYHYPYLRSGKRGTGRAIQLPGSCMRELCRQARRLFYGFLCTLLVHNQHLKPILNIRKAHIRVIIQRQKLNIRIQLL